MYNEQHGGGSDRHPTVTHHSGKVGDHMSKRDDVKVMCHMHMYNWPGRHIPILFLLQRKRQHVIIYSNDDHLHATILDSLTISILRATTTTKN